MVCAYVNTYEQVEVSAYACQASVIHLPAQYQLITAAPRPCPPPCIHQGIELVYGFELVSS